MGLKRLVTFDRIPDLIRKRLLIRMKIDNSRRIYLLSWIGFIFLFLFIALDVIRFQGGKIEYGGIYFTLFITHLLFALFIIPIVIFRIQRNAFLSGKSEYAMYYIYAWTIYLSVLLTFMSVLSLFERGSLSLYAIYILVINLSIVMRHRERIYLNLLSFLVIIIAITTLYFDDLEGM